MSATSESRKAASGSPDYTMLLNRIRKAILHEEGSTEAVTAQLQQSSVWRQLDPENMREWAGLCQQVGAFQTAEAVYIHLTRTCPEYEPGRRDFLEMLALLGKSEQLAAEVARAKADFPGETLPQWIRSQFGATASKGVDDAKKSDAAAVAPFETMLEQRDLMRHYLTLFSGREDHFARQWADGKENKSGYVPVRRAMTLSDVSDHLSGVKTYGIYLLRADSTVTCGVIDADLKADCRSEKMDAKRRSAVHREKGYMISQIIENSKRYGIFPLLEFSGSKGYHFWYFLDRPVPASRMKGLITDIADPVDRDLSCFDLEVFPKQDRLTGKGFGNLVKLPLGIHRKSGKPSTFPGCGKRDLESQLQYLKTVTPADISVFEKKEAMADNAGHLDPLEYPGKTGNPDPSGKTGNPDPSGKTGEARERIVLHPRMASFAREFPELYALERLCPPMGKIIVACREGKALTTREEKVLFQTIGFLPRRKLLMHTLLSRGADYNPHMVDFKLGKITGTPLGCRRIHSLTDFTGNDCPLTPDATGYRHPLIHLEEWKACGEKKSPKGERISNLQDALENLKTAMVQVERFMG